MIIQRFRHTFISPTLPNVMIPLRPSTLGLYTLNTPSAPLSIILDNGIGIVHCNFAFFTYSAFPTHFHLICWAYGTTDAWRSIKTYYESSEGITVLGGGRDAGRHLLHICTYFSFPLRFTGAGEWLRLLSIARSWNKLRQWTDSLSQLWVPFGRWDVPRMDIGWCRVRRRFPR